MSEVIVYGLSVYAFAVAGWAGWLIVRNRQVSDGLFYFTSTLEALLVVQVVFGFVNLATTERSIDGVTFGGYLLTLPLLLPIGFAWGASDKSRWGPGVVVISALVVIVLLVRLLQIWRGVGA